MRGHEIEDELTLSQAADAAGVSRSTVRRMLERGELPGARQDERSRWLVTVGALRAAGLSVGEPARERAREQGAERGAAGERAQGAVTLLDQLAPLIEQLTNLQRERGEIETELRVAQFRLAQVSDRPGRAGAGLMLAAGALLAAAGGWALAPELHLVGAGLTAGAALLAAGWAWLTR
jgi:excisionase family DNA binding protein